MIWRLSRYLQGEAWTVGALNTGRELLCTLERGWKGNAPDVSRIPEGDYRIATVLGDRKRIRLEGNGCYETEAQMRTSKDGERFAIDIHIANTTSELLGCIAVGYGLHFGLLPGIEPALTDSAAAMNDLLALVPKDRAVRIEIRDRF